MSIPCKVLKEKHEYLSTLREILRCCNNRTVNHICPIGFLLPVMIINKELKLITENQGSLLSMLIKYTKQLDEEIMKRETIIQR